MSALGLELVRRGYTVLFRPCELLVQELLRSKRDLEIARVLKKPRRYQVIIVDDIGYVQQSREEMEVLFSFLSDRYERGSVMMTSNLAFSDLSADGGSPHFLGNSPCPCYYLEGTPAHKRLA